MDIIICYFFIYTVEAFILWQYTAAIFTSRYNRLWEGLALFFGYSVLYGLSFLNHFLINMSAFLIINFLFFFFMFYVKWYSALFHAAISTIIMSTSEWATYSLMTFFAPDFFAKETFFRNLSILAIFSKTIYFLVFYGLSHLFRGKETFDNSKNKTTLFLILVPISSLCVMHTVFSIFRYSDLPVHLDWLASFSAVLMLFVNILVFAINNNTQRKNAAFMELQLLLQKEYDSTLYYKMLSKQTENQNILIHDIKKHLQSISLLNEKGEQARIADYIDALIHSSDLQDNVSMCDNETLNAILCRYQMQCKDNSISFHTDIRSSCLDFLTDNDLTALFCNLLDNSFEAAEQIPNASIELSIGKRENTPFTIITLENSCRKNPLSTNGGILSTTKPDKLRHGYGMKSIKRIVEKYHGDMQMYYDEKTSTFHTIIALRFIA